MHGQGWHKQEDRSNGEKKDISYEFSHHNLSLTPHRIRMEDLGLGK